MTRIIQRCLLVLAFTGVLLASSQKTTQETTVSDVSDSTAKSSEQTLPSAPESRSYSVEKSSSYSPTDTTEDHSFPSTADSSSKHEAPSVSSTGLKEVDDDTASEHPSSENGPERKMGLESTTQYAAADTDNTDHHSIVQSTFVSTTEVNLNKAEIQEADPKDNLIYNNTLENALNSSDKDVDSSTNSVNNMEKQDISVVSSQPATSTGMKKISSDTTSVSELKETSVTASPSENTSSDYGQSSVPSVEVSVYSTSKVDHTTDKMFSTTPSKVQTVESNTSDLPKSATRKRSLNATNTAGSNVSSASTMHVTTPLSSEFTNEVTEKISVENINKDSRVSSETDIKDFRLLSTVVTNTDSIDSKSGTPSHIDEIESTGSPFNVNQNVKGNYAQNTKDKGEQHVPKTSASSLDNTHIFPTSSPALTVDNGESTNSFKTTDHTPNLEISSIPSATIKTNEKLIEMEDGLSATSSDSPRKISSSVTFDPNGMTHNYTQDPDSITFTPETFHVDGMPTNGYLSRLEENEFTSNKPLVGLQHGKSAESSTNGNLGSSSTELEINTPEREREYISPSVISVFPHDEPDLEEMSDKHTPPNSKKEAENQFSKVNSPQTQTGIPVQTKKPPVHLPNDESEEMLNDSPYFDQSKFTPISNTEVKIKEITHALNKALEMNVSNDITPSTGINSQNTPETLNELDFPVDYQTAQSEIRPVTVVSPLEISDSKIFSPVPTKAETNLQHDQPDTTLPNTSSPIILPNPAPSIANLRAKATTIELPLHLLPPGYVHKPETENENKSLENSSIGVTSLKPKLTVVEMPPHLLPPGYVPEAEAESKSEISKDSTVATANLRPKVTATELPANLLPPGYKPVPEPDSKSGTSKVSSVNSANLRPKVIATEFPPNLLPPGFKPGPERESEKGSSSSTTNLRSKITATEFPAHLLPPGFKPEPEAENKSETPKDSSSSTTSTKPKISAIDIPLHLLPPGYVPDSEAETASEASKNSTIAGVAVKTSVSVSLPLSKGANSSTSPKEVNENSSSLPVIVNVAASEAPTESTTQASGFKIRKPKIKIGGTEEPASPRTRKPLLTAYQRPSSTVGPPVSIFKKRRTRANSITSSTTARPLGQYSTIRIHYASRMPGMVPNGEMVFSFEPITMTTTVPTTTETEEPFSDEPFNEPTQTPVVSSDDDVTLIKVAGYIVVDKGLRWFDQLNNRHSPLYKERANYVHLQLERLFRSSPIAQHLWKIQIDGFSGIRSTRSVAVDFFLYLVKSKKDIPASQLVSVFNDKLKNNTFSRFTVDPSKTNFEIMNEEPLRTTTPPPEEERESVLPQWAIAVIVVGAASLIFIILFAAVAILGRHHVRRRYGNKLNDEDSDRPSDWESKMAAAYENLAADTIYDADDMHGDTSYKKSYLVD